MLIDPEAELMRPRSIVAFERLLVVALALDLLINLASWSAFPAQLAAKGLPTSPVLILLLCLFSPALGAVFLYFVGRRGSNVARWILTVLVALGVVGFVVILAADFRAAATPLFAATATSEVLKVIAVTRLFTAEAARWFERSSGR